MTRFYSVFSDLTHDVEISTTMHGLDSDKEDLRSDPEKFKILFNEMIQMCLWWIISRSYFHWYYLINLLPQGKRDSKTTSHNDYKECWSIDQDLSLLTHLSEDDIRHLQSVGKDAQAARKQFILKDDQEAIWNHLQSLSGGRIDFVLDNCALSFWSSNSITDKHDLFFSQLGLRSASLFGYLQLIMFSWQYILAIYRSRICRFLGDLYTICF
jgi:hypothetical protein